MQRHARRRLDGILLIGPHGLDAQLRALVDYATRTEHTLDVLWAMLPGEDPATDAPDSSFPIVAFDDEIAGLTPDEHARSAAEDDAPGRPVTDWHVAHAIPRPKRPTTHLPVYGYAGDREIAADAVLCVGTESLDRQIARIEAYAIRSAIRVRGVYIASDPENLRVLLRDFCACNKALGAGPTLTVGPRREVEVHY